jgi:16S rRNA (cytidine1402-2'-O)-methyltransferase
MIVEQTDTPTDDAPLPPGLYIVATPIGNLGDLSPRATSILSRAETIAVEDSRVTAKLLNRIGVKRRMTPYHDHSGDHVRPELIARMASGAVALVSDAGTPLISDPGYKLVRDAPRRRHRGHHYPGAVRGDRRAHPRRAAHRPLSSSSASCHRRRKRGADAIAEIADIRATLIMYESGPRLGATLAALAAGLGDREAAVAREISKTFEETVTASLLELAERYAESGPKGEIVIIVGPPGEAPARDRGGCRHAAARGADPAAGRQGRERGRKGDRTQPARSLHAGDGAQRGRLDPARGRAARPDRRGYRRLVAAPSTAGGSSRGGMRTRHGEIDLIARRGRVLAFVEVKTRGTARDLATAIDEHRLRRVVAAASGLVARFGQDATEIRIDVMLVRPWRLPIHLVNVWHGGG